MRKFLITTALTIFAFQTQASVTEFNVTYGSAEPDTGSVDSFNELSIGVHYENVSNRYYAIDLHYNSRLDEGNLLLALHYGWAGSNAHFGGVAGIADGETQAIFGGIEWGYTGSKIDVKLRASYWDLEALDRGNMRYDVNVAYNFWNNFGVFYDYTHQFASKGGFKGDEFLTGLEYTLGNGVNARFGIGNVHPQNTLTGESDVWTQYAFSLSIPLGGKSRIDDIDIVNFYDY